MPTHTANPDISTSLISRRFHNASWTNLDWAAIGLERFVYRAWNGLHNSVNEPWLHGLDEKLGANLLITTGAISEHCDSEELPPYSYHAIIRNDGYIARSTGQEVKNLAIQERGIVIALNIHEEHEVIRDLRINDADADDFDPYLTTWCSLCFNDDKLLPWDEVERRFNQIAANIQTALDNKIPLIKN